MGQDVKATRNGRRIAMKGIMFQLSQIELDDRYTSLAGMLHSNNMWDFIFNEVEVSAQQAATISHLYSFLHPRSKV